MFDEQGYLMLSGIQHFAFCPRQWALIHVERQWADNFRTAEGELLHKNAHDPTFNQKRGALLICRAMPVFSREMGVSGECDVVEFMRDENGVNLSGKDGKYRVVPVEYKRGKPKEDETDELQLAAQAMCLEEMLMCDVDYGYLYYGETGHRKKTEIGADLRKIVAESFEKMHAYLEKGFTPRVKSTKRCNACSLKELCLPSIERNKSAGEYIENALKDDEL